MTEPSERAERLPVRCVGCQRPMTVLYRQRHSSDVVMWTCPYSDCRKLHSNAIGGIVDGVEFGWSDEDTRTLDS